MTDSSDAAATYDSGPETREHIAQVARRLQNVCTELRRRGHAHDASKLGPEEKPIFDQVTPKLKGLTYGSDEYRQSLKALGPALTHHYAKNSHHPESRDGAGIAGMDLLDLIEMYCDWAAATLRTKDGDMAKGIEHNVGRFKMDPQLAAIFRNTWDRHSGFTGYAGHQVPQDGEEAAGWSQATDAKGQFYLRKPNPNVPLNSDAHPAS